MGWKTFPPHKEQVKQAKGQVCPLGFLWGGKLILIKEKVIF